MNFDPAPWNNWLLLFLSLSGVITILAKWIVRGAKRREENAQRQRDDMVALIKDVTKQIQPKANGGFSLTDVAKGVQDLRIQQTEISDRLRGMDERFTARMDESDATRARIMQQVAAEQEAWATAMARQGIDTPPVSKIEPVEPKRHRRGRKIEDEDGMK